VSRSGPCSSLDLLLGSSLICISGGSFDLSSVCLSSLLFSVSVRLSAAPQIGCLRPGKKTPSPTFSFSVAAVSKNLVV
jgi:hypothetical protein